MMVRYLLGENVSAFSKNGVWGCVVHAARSHMDMKEYTSQGTHKMG